MQPQICMQFIKYVCEVSIRGSEITMKPLCNHVGVVAIFLQRTCVQRNGESSVWGNLREQESPLAPESARSSSITNERE